MTYENSLISSNSKADGVGKILGFFLLQAPIYFLSQPFKSGPAQQANEAYGSSTRYQSITMGRQSGQELGVSLLCGPNHAITGQPNVELAIFDVLDR